MRSGLVALSASAALLLVVAATPVRAEWTAAQTLSRPHAFVVPGGVQPTRGDAVAVWNWADERVEGRSMRAVGLSGGRVAAERDLPAGTVAGPVVDGRGRVVIATQADRDGRGTLAVRVGAGADRFGRSRVVARARSIDDQQLVANAHGDVALGWLVGRGTSSVRVFVSVRPRGRAFAAPVLLGRGRIVDMSIAIGRGGGVLVAWHTPGGIVRARVGKAGERAFDRVQELRSRRAVVQTLQGVQTAVDDDGGAWVAWSGQSYRTCCTGGTAFVELARRHAGATRFGPVQLLERARESVPSAVALAVGAGANAVVAWWIGHYEAGQPSRTEVRAAQTDAVGATRTDTVARFVAVDSEDIVTAAARSGPSPAMSFGAAVLWTQSTDAGEEIPTPLWASVLAPAGVAAGPGSLPAWGAPELVTSAAHPTASIVAAYPDGADALVALFAHRRSDGRAVLQHSIRR